MATTIYTCGPAALATVLKNMGIFTSEAEITQLAGTDQTGTSLYGLQQATINKGLTATGVRITADQLQPDYIIVLNINDQNHYEIIKSINSTTVILIDPNLGQIEMTRTQFQELYTGIALIINNTIPSNATILTENEMKDTKAMLRKVLIGVSRIQIGGYYTVTWKKTPYKVPYTVWKWIPTTKMWGWLTIPGHYMPYVAWKSIWVPVIKYTPIYIVTSHYRLIPEEGDKYRWDVGYGMAIGAAKAMGASAGIAIAGLLSGGTMAGVAAIPATPEIIDGSVQFWKYWNEPVWDTSGS